MLRCHQWNAFAVHFVSHYLGLVETEQFVPIVDEQIEVSEEALAKNSPNPGIG